MRTKRYLSLLLAALMGLTLTACGAALKKDKKASMSIQPAQLSEEETALMELLDIDPADYRLFDFNESGAKSIRLRAYELSDGEWDCVAHSAYETVDGEGRIALTFGKMTEGVRMAHRDGTGIGSHEFAMEAGDTSGMTFTTSVLGEAKTIELDQEIPLAIQIVTSKNEIRSYDVSYFGMPREYAKHDYEHVYAITVTFTAKAASELLDAPSAEPSPAD